MHDMYLKETAAYGSLLNNGPNEEQWLKGVRSAIADACTTRLEWVICSLALWPTKERDPSVVKQKGLAAVGEFNSMAKTDASLSVVPFLWQELQKALAWVEPKPAPKAAAKAAVAKPAKPVVRANKKG
jgi:hypothetical protein